MRNKVAKKLKMEVAYALYVGDDVTKEDISKARKSVFSNEDFKATYRARKKNYNRTEQVVKNIKLDIPPAEIVALMRKTRLKNRKKYKI